MLHWRAVKGLLTGVFLTKDLNYADTALYKFAKLPDPLKSKWAQNWHFWTILGKLWFLWFWAAPKPAFEARWLNQTNPRHRWATPATTGLGTSTLEFQNRRSQHVQINFVGCFRGFCPSWRCHRIGRRRLWQSIGISGHRFGHVLRSLVIIKKN